MKIKTSGDLPNEEGFSNVVNWNKANEFVEGIKDTLNRNAGKTDELVVKPAPVSETTILGMHPMTLMIVTVSVLALGITGIIIYNKSK